ncbi:MAG: phosphatase PAP2 family protein [Chloroflexaceae bacterium]|nr:phosphatase PAP2 family protein [Chloroflexaceae bacterium]
MTLKSFPRFVALLSGVWLGGFTIAILALVSFFAIAHWVFGETSAAIDAGILQAIHGRQSLILDRITLVITRLGEPNFLIGVAASFGLVVLSQKRWISTVSLGIVTIGAVVLNTLLKDLFERSRPQLWERIIDVGQYSFPSGHAMISLVVYGFISYWLIARYPIWRRQIVLLAIAVIAAIGFSRLYLGVHWPTDILAGYAAGSVWLLACILGLELAKTLYQQQTLS